MRLSKEEREHRFSEFIFFMKDYKKLNQKDLDFCMNYYLGKEDYEKCSVIRDLKPDNRRNPYLNWYENVMGGWKSVDRLIEKYDFLNDPAQQRLVKSQEENEDMFWHLIDNVKTVFSKCELHLTNGKKINIHSKNIKEELDNDLKRVRSKRKK